MANLRPGEKLYAQLNAQSGGNGIVFDVFVQAILRMGWSQDIARKMWSDTDLNRNNVLELSEFLTLASKSDVTPQIIKAEALLPPQAYQTPQSFPQAMPQSMQQGQAMPQSMQQGQAMQSMQQGQAMPQTMPRAQALPQGELVGGRLYDYMDQRSGRTGHVPYSEFDLMVKAVGWSPDIAGRMWSDTDNDRSGGLTRDEFLVLANKTDVAPYITKMEQQVCGGGMQQGMMQQGMMQQGMMQQGMMQQGMQQGMQGGQSVAGFYGAQSSATGGSYPGHLSQQQRQLQEQQVPESNQHVISGEGGKNSIFWKTLMGGGGSKEAAAQLESFASNCQGRKRALFIGINYFNTKNELKGCINDVHNIRQFVQQAFGFQDILVLTDDQTDPKFQPTRANMTNGMRWLIEGAQPGDSFFLHYSGHGGQAKDSDGDEDEGIDETIFPVDFASAGQMVDDEIKHLVVDPLPKGARLTAIFDSCHSGTAMDLPFSYGVNGKLEIIEVDNRKEALKSAGRAALSYFQGDKKGAVSNLLQGLLLYLDRNKQKME